MTPPADDWVQWSQYVLKSLESLNDGQDRLRDDISDLKQSVVERNATQDAALARGLQAADAKMADNSQKIAKLEEISGTNKWFTRGVIGAIVFTLISSLVALALAFVKPDPQPSRRGNSDRVVQHEKAR